VTEARGAATFRTAPEAYDRHVGRYSNVLGAELVRFASVERGQRALDVGCGPGALTRALAERLGADAVAAVDPNAPFVETCRARVPGADVRDGSAEALPFDDGAFDAVLSQLVVNFITDAPAAVREMRRVARPGGTIAACVWDYAGGMTLLRAFWDAAQEVDRAGAAARDEARVMRWCTPAQLEELWTGAGLRDVRGGELSVEARYSGFGELWEPLESGHSPSGAFAASLDPERRAALREALHRRLGAPDGPFALRARAWAVAGRVP
jgi:SAM-dependent methyltransferase